MLGGPRAVLREGLKPRHRGETRLRLVYAVFIEVGFRLDVPASSPRAIQPECVCGCVGGGMVFVCVGHMCVYV